MIKVTRVTKSHPHRHPENIYKTFHKKRQFMDLNLLSGDWVILLLFFQTSREAIVFRKNTIFNDIESKGGQVAVSKFRFIIIKSIFGG